MFLILTIESHYTTLPPQFIITTGTSHGIVSSSLKFDTHWIVQGLQPQLLHNDVEIAM